MDSLHQRALEAPDYLTFLHLVDKSTPTTPHHYAFALTQQLCHTLERFLSFEKARLKGELIDPAIKANFREAWVTYKRTIQRNKHLYHSAEFQALRLKAFAELGFSENRWDELESSVPHYNPADNRDHHNLRNRISL